MNLIKYNLLSNGDIPNYIVDGGYFPKLNNNNSPKDYDLIGISENNIGLENFTTKLDFENYIKSFNPNTREVDGTVYNVQDQINIIWNKK